MARSFFDSEVHAGRKAERGRGKGNCPPYSKILMIRSVCTITPGRFVICVLQKILRMGRLAAMGDCGLLNNQHCARRVCWIQAHSVNFLFPPPPNPLLREGRQTETKHFLGMTMVLVYPHENKTFTKLCQLLSLYWPGSKMRVRKLLRGNITIQGGYRAWLYTWIYLKWTKFLAATTNVHVV